MRVLSSKPVVQSAESITRKILDTYLEPVKTFVELRDMANNGTIDLLHEFSATCREELEDMEARQLKFTPAIALSRHLVVPVRLWAKVQSSRHSTTATG